VSALILERSDALSERSKNQRRISSLLGSFLLNGMPALHQSSHRTACSHRVDYAANQISAPAA
jgi:hypothetical protein